MADTATTLLQEQVLSSVKTAQDATLKIAKEWTKVLGSAPTAPEFYALPKPEAFYGFAEKLWGVEKDFFVGLLEVATEVGKTLPDTVKKAAATATPKA